MRVINVLTIKNNVVNNIESFGVFEEQLSDDVVKEAEKCFKETISSELDYDEDDDPNVEDLIEDGYFQNLRGSVCISWSDI